MTNRPITTKLNRMLFASALMLTLATPAFAQTAPTTPATPPVLNASEETQRDTNQQNRIENGLKDGQLSTGEAARLEKGESRIDNQEARDMKNGPMTAGEKAQIQREQNNESRQIYKDDNNGIKGNPNSASSKRMQADVQRNANQEQRIHNGVKNGSLTNREAGRLEHGQARTDRMEYRGGRNGHMGAWQQRRIQNRDNRQSNHIYNKKHNGVRRHRG